MYGSTGIELSGLNYIKGISKLNCIQAEPSCLAYKNECRHWDKCIDNIDPEDIFNYAYHQLFGDISHPSGDFEFIKQYPTICGYTTIYNGVDAKFPFIESIQSALGFCDSVVIVEGESTDGTYEKLNEVFGNDSRVQIYLLTIFFHLSLSLSSNISSQSN